MLRRVASATFAGLLIACGAAVQAAPQKSIAELMQGLDAAGEFQETLISPDHRYVAWVQSTAAENASAAGAAIYLARADRSAPPVRLTAAKAANARGGAAVTEKDMSWAPDSSSLAFLSDAQSPGQMQLYAVRVADRSVRRLTELKGFLATPHWSPDGRKIAFLFTGNAVRQAGPLAAAAPVVGVVDQQIYEQRIATVDVAGGEAAPVSPSDLYVYEYDWSPDGSHFAASAAHGSGDNNWYVAEIYTIDAAGGDAHSVLKAHMQIAVPRWSPDGKWIAFIGGLMSDEGIASGDVYLMPASGGEPRNLTPGHPASAFWMGWRANSRDLVLAEAQDGGSAIAELRIDTGVLHTRWQGAETVRGPADFARGISLAADGETGAVIRESFDRPPAIWSGRIGAWKPLSPGAPQQASAWGRAENMHWQSDGLSVQGWLIPPASVDPSRKYPMVVWIHGGPAWLTAPSWPSTFESSRVSLLAARGYYVFYPNPRGSAGYGEQFKRANVKDFGGGDLRDILAGIEHVVATHPVDDRRVGLSGWSYGGYMTMWALTQSQRFRAAVVGAGLSDWLSYYGENGIDEWMIPYFGASVYDDPAVYAKSSPINFVKHVSTPTLLVVGDGDVECPPPQSFEYWHALKAFNVETQLVIYPHEGHRLADRLHVVDYMQRLSAWFDDHMPADADH